MSEHRDFRDTLEPATIKTRPGLTVHGVFDRWFATIVDSHNKKTVKSYQRLATKYIFPYIGDIEIDDLTVADIEQFLDDRRNSIREDGQSTLSAKTVSNIAWLLRTALAQAEWKNTFQNRAKKFVKTPPKPHALDTLSVEQMDALTNYLLNHPDRFHAGILLCLFAGLRLSEICALKDADLNFQYDTVAIRRTLKRASMRQIDENGPEQYTVEYGADGGGRCFHMPVRLTMLLWSIVRNTAATAGNVFFLTGSATNLMNLRSCQAQFQSILARANLPHVSFHDLRHTFVLLWLLRERDFNSLRLALGHTSTRETERRYGDLLEKVDMLQGQPIPNADLLCKVVGLEQMDERTPLS